MESVMGKVVAGLIADVVELHHQHEATRGLFLALARAAARNGTIAQSDMSDAMQAASAYLAATGRQEAATLMAPMLDEIRIFAFGGEPHMIAATEPAEISH